MERRERWWGGVLGEEKKKKGESGDLDRELEDRYSLRSVNEIVHICADSVEMAATRLPICRD